MPAIAPTPQNTCAVIVTRHHDEELPNRIRDIQAQFSLVIVVDNGSPPASLEMLRTMAESPQVYLAENQANLGIATALNQGVDLALKRGFKWVVTLDQDTRIFADLLTTLISVYEKSGKNNVMIGSNYWNAHKQQDFIRCTDNAAGFRERKTLITSGSLMSSSMFSAIGLFRDDYFIDSVDHEFCLRARRYGWRILISCKPVMSQCIGSCVENASRLRRVMAFNHSPVRKYFIARNTVATVMSYFCQEPAWCVRQGLRLLSDFSSILLFEEDKIKKITAFIVGVAHGVAGKMGPIEESWPNGADRH